MGTFYSILKKILESYPFKGTVCSLQDQSYACDSMLMTILRYCRHCRSTESLFLWKSRDFGGSNLVLGALAISKTMLVMKTMKPSPISQTLSPTYLVYFFFHGIHLDNILYFSQSQFKNFTSVHPHPFRPSRGWCEAHLGLASNKICISNKLKSLKESLRNDDACKVDIELPRILNDKKSYIIYHILYKWYIRVIMCEIINLTNYTFIITHP